MITDLAVLRLRDLAPVDYRPGDPLPPAAQRRDALHVRCRVTDADTLPLASGGPRIRLDLSGPWTCAPDVARLVADGVVECALNVDIGRTDIDADAQWLFLLTLLRDAREHGLHVQWSFPEAGPDWLDTGQLVHLPPPDGDTPQARDWRARHRYAGLYWRRGPGFITVVDARSGDDARYVIDDPDLLTGFDELSAPLPLTGCSPSVTDAVEQLHEAELVVVAGGHAVRLPYRLRHRPVPGYSV